MKYFGQRLVLIALLLAQPTQADITKNPDQIIPIENSPKGILPQDMILQIDQYLSDQEAGRLSQASQGYSLALKSELERRRWKKQLKEPYLNAFQKLKEALNEEEDVNSAEGEVSFSAFFESTKKLKVVELDQLSQILQKQGFFDQLQNQLSDLNQWDANTQGLTWNCMVPNRAFGFIECGFFVAGALIGDVSALLMSIYTPMSCCAQIGTAVGFALGGGVLCGIVPPASKIAWRNYYLTGPMDQNLEVQHELEADMDILIQSLEDDQKVLEKDPVFQDIFKKFQKVIKKADDLEDSIESMRGYHSLQMFDEVEEI
jgi:hypothetical protein